MNKRKLSRKIESALHDAGIRRREAAAALDLPTEGLFRRLTGRVPWRVHELETLAAMCGVPLSTWLDDNVTVRPEHVSTIVSRVLKEIVHTQESKKRGA
ncbi:MAG: hypothetical protein GY847_00900 [Proteobacteria bacterium]|nr:hypothetical protein [Pseudomonadota bacterium]